jgi:hypothetical protein
MTSRPQDWRTEVQSTAGRNYRELAQCIAQQAQSLADGTHTGPAHAVVRLLLSNTETLKAWTPDDRGQLT